MIATLGYNVMHLCWHDYSSCRAHDVHGATKQHVRSDTEGWRSVQVYRITAFADTNSLLLRISIFWKMQVSPTYYAHVWCSHFAAIQPFLFLLGALNAPWSTLHNVSDCSLKLPWAQNWMQKREHCPFNYWTQFRIVQSGIVRCLFIFKKKFEFCAAFFFFNRLWGNIF